MCNTAQPILNYGMYYLQDSALLVIRNNGDDDIEQEGMLVPRKAFTNSYAPPFQQFFMNEPIDRGNHAHQKVLVLNKVVGYFMIKLLTKSQVFPGRILTGRKSRRNSATEVLFDFWRQTLDTRVDSGYVTDLPRGDPTGCRR
jgi:hypothetical protein